MEFSNLSGSPEFGKYSVSTFDLYCQERVQQSCKELDVKCYFKHLKGNMDTTVLPVHGYK